MQLLRFQTFGRFFAHNRQFSCLVQSASILKWFALSYISLIQISANPTELLWMAPELSRSFESLSNKLSAVLAEYRKLPLELQDDRALAILSDDLRWSTESLQIADAWSTGTQPPGFYNPSLVLSTFIVLQRRRLAVFRLRPISCSSSKCRKLLRHIGDGSALFLFWVGPELRSIRRRSSQLVVRARL